MTDVEFLFAVKGRSESSLAGLLLPVQMQEEDDAEPKPREATTYLVRLKDDIRSIDKKAPCVIHTMADGEDRYTDHHDGYGGKELTRHLVNKVELRSVFCCYAKDGQEGGLYLLEMMDRFRRSLLRHPVLGSFQLDLDAGLLRQVYDSDEWDLGNFHVGGMVSRWVERTPPRPDVQAILRGDDGPGKIPGVYSETKTFLKGATEDHGE